MSETLNALSIESLGKLPKAKYAEATEILKNAGAKKKAPPKRRRAAQPA